jgi:CheY-like chemotaxis protein
LPAALKGISVLLVDDDPDELTVIGALLSGAGADVTAVSKVEDALRAMQVRRPRVLVSDLMIPGHDGFTLIRRVRRMEEEEGGSLPALAISGHSAADQRRYALEEGFNEYIAKPVHEQIVDTVARLARRRRSAEKKVS